MRASLPLVELYILGLYFVDRPIDAQIKVNVRFTTSVCQQSYCSFLSSLLQQQQQQQRIIRRGKRRESPKQVAVGVIRSMNLARGSGRQADIPCLCALLAHESVS